MPSIDDKRLRIVAALLQAGMAGLSWRTCRVSLGPVLLRVRNPEASA